MLTKISILIFCVVQICAFENNGIYEILNHTLNLSVTFNGLDTINLYSTDSILTDCSVIFGTDVITLLDTQICTFNISNSCVTTNYTILLYSMNDEGTIIIKYEGHDCKNNYLICKIIFYVMVASPEFIVIIINCIIMYLNLSQKRPNRIANN